MGTIAIRAKQKIRSVKDKWKEIYMRHRYLSGITVIELVLILVIKVLMYIEYIEGEKFPKNKLYTRYTQEHGQLKCC